MGFFKDTGRAAWGWAFNDWANSAFATSVMGVFFPIMFKQYWSAGAAATTSTFRLGMVNSVSSVVVALLSPILGIIADRGSKRKKFLFFFTLLGVVMTGGLFMAAKGDWQLAALLYLLASMGFSGSLTFYDALLVLVSSEERRDMTSALGYSLGYLGGGLLFAVNILMVSKPALFGFADASEAVKICFLTVAAWWLLFSIPLFLFVKEEEGNGAKLTLLAVGEGFRELLGTIRAIGDHRPAFLFLAAYWLYIDGVDTIIRMAVDFGLGLGFTNQSLMTAFLVTQFVGFPAAIIYGKLGVRFGIKRAIYFGLGVYVLVVAWAFNMSQAWEFYMLSIAVGLVQGGVQALSRSYFASLIPQDRSAEFFGFYNMLGKSAAVLGPLMMGLAATLLNSTRAAILPILLLLAGGALVLRLVPEPGASNP